MPKHAKTKLLSMLAMGLLSSVLGLSGCKQGPTGAGVKADGVAGGLSIALGPVSHVGNADAYDVYFATSLDASSVVYQVGKTLSCPLVAGNTADKLPTRAVTSRLTDRHVFVSLAPVAITDGAILVACSYNAGGALITKIGIKFQKQGQDANGDPVFTQTQTSYQLTAYLLPSPDQLGAGSCLYMAATGLMDFLLNQSLDVRHPALRGDTDISAEYTLTLASAFSLANPYTDILDLFYQAGGYVRDRDLPFRAYGDESWVNGTGISLTNLKPIGGLPKIGKKVIYSAGGEGTQMQNHLMQASDIEAIKQALITYRSPILFVFHPDGVNYYHTDLIYGYDDDRATFLARDSAFGNKMTDIPPYQYDGHSPWGPQPYRDTYDLTYANAQSWGNHATVYFLSK